VVTHQLQVERRTGKVRRPETDVLPQYVIYFAIAAVAVGSNHRPNHHPLREVDSVHLQILLIGVDNVVHGLSLATITGRPLGETPFVQVSTTWALTCPETVHQRPCMTREIETLLSDSRVGNNSLVETIGKATFRPSSRLERKQISSGAEFQPNRQTTTYSGPNLNQQTARLCRCLVRVTRSKCRELTQTVPSD